jgi:hypothetical protein
MQIKFSYPIRGLEGSFVTFRLGARAAATLQPGTEVELVNSRTGKLLKLATVTQTFTGQLNQMASLHAHQAHNWKTHPEAERPGLLIASMIKRYPPGRCVDTSIVSVICLTERTP